MNECEDEYHFVINCHLYEVLRKDMISKLIELYPIAKDLKDVNLYMWVMANLDPNVILLVAKYVSECFRLRSMKMEI